MIGHIAIHNCNLAKKVRTLSGNRLSGELVAQQLIRANCKSVERSKAKGKNNKKIGLTSPFFCFLHTLNRSIVIDWSLMEKPSNAIGHHSITNLTNNCSQP